MRVIGIALVLHVATGVADAAMVSRPAKPAERKAIVKVMRTYIDTSGCCGIITRIKVYDLRISTVNLRWASILINGWDEAGKEVGVVRASLYKGNLSGRWSVRAFGSSDTGCPMPPAVRRDLRLDCFPR